MLEQSATFAFVFSLFSSFAFAGVVDDETKRAESLENLSSRVTTLQECAKDRDCVRTEYENLLCKAGCDRCGLVIHRREMPTFKMLQRQAVALGRYDCSSERCTKQKRELQCEVFCDRGQCSAALRPKALPPPRSS